MAAPASGELIDRLEQDGIAKIPLLAPSQIERLRRRVAPFVPGGGTGIFTTYRGDDPEDRRRLQETIFEELGPLVDEIMPGRQLLQAGVFVKRPGLDSAVALHQDWSYVDETTDRSFTLWVPLVDADENTGRVHAVVGSHRLGLTRRGTPEWPNAFREVRPLLEESYLRPFDASVGEALLIDHATLHGSLPNRTTRPRIAVLMAFTRLNADILHFHIASDGRRYEFRVDPRYFLDCTLNGRPSGPHLLDRREIEEAPLFFSTHDLSRLQRAS